jgi:putative transposase
MSLPDRKWLSHVRPPWVDAEDPISLTFCGKPRGLNQFARPDRWGRITAAVEHLSECRLCAPLLLLAMPDHLHMIVMVPSRPGIASFVARFKRAAGYGLDISWQRGAFDHRIRNDDSYREKWAYVMANPLRAGLISSTETWSYVKSWP